MPDLAMPCRIARVGRFRPSADGMFGCTVYGPRRYSHQTRAGRHIDDRATRPHGWDLEFHREKGGFHVGGEDLIERCLLRVGQWPHRRSARCVDCEVQLTEEIQGQVHRRLYLRGSRKVRGLHANPKPSIPTRAAPMLRVQRLYRQSSNIALPSNICLVGKTIHGNDIRTLLEEQHMGRCENGFAF